MTTPISPDGLPPTTIAPTSESLVATSAEQVRDWDEVKKIIAQRDAAKAREDALEARLAAIEGKVIIPAAPPAPTGQAAVASEIDKRLAALEATRTAEQRAERRKMLEGAVIGAAAETHREQIRGALALLAVDGAIDLHAEDAGGEAAKALAKLRALHPGSFATATTSAAAPGGQHDLLPPGVELHELTAEQLARIPDEKFSELRRQARTSKLAI